ncbi:hypothetical protein IEO21_06237 [Rhodonia placenta]|uniref:Uncharacterized protein n=2 Tax=Rhodonia placenta TaxID=104341 RepID=A0A8H7P0Q3_9APHY|nr:hypothetical protein IEO21_06237 [Postia placenta]
MLASGGKKETPAPSAGKSVLEQAKESVKFNAGSRCVEAEMDSIKKFVEEAEKDAKH